MIFQYFCLKRENNAIIFPIKRKLNNNISYRNHEKRYIILKYYYYKIIIISKINSYQIKVIL